MARKSEFLPAKDQSEAEFIHPCDSGKKPYANVEEISEELRIVTCPLCGFREYHQFTSGRTRAPKVTLRLITPHAGGRTARIDLRVRPEIKQKAQELATQQGISVDDLFDYLIDQASI